MYEKETYYRIIHPEQISIFGNSISDHRMFHRSITGKGRLRTKDTIEPLLCQRQ